MLPIQPANRKKATPLAKYSGQGPEKMRVAKDTTILVFKIPKIAVEVRFEITVSASKLNFFASSLTGYTFLSQDFYSQRSVHFLNST
jgi:hypothetical protein